VAGNDARQTGREFARDDMQIGTANTAGAHA
jgi:hypothetical protein